MDERHPEQFWRSGSSANGGLPGGVWLSLVYTASTDTFTAYWSTSYGFRDDPQRITMELGRQLHGADERADV